ncbi:ABC-type transport system involved in multi-copper enzyme maturation permease subunit [Natronospira proteinivora]|uniref:ABC-type transport system involved in multi-copper enzyme maturation permease subunit n=1 Tax=Natronospira proteinivora TaxID=1807133 RepID=A0ABT1GE35_9GAMM|nr:hypothetical protein [Natronospira proteinivora]MCP1728212.1 ABC-type transport system involved in multi-copper enzyme maturation permease subunit [Natronospira proteinivora]
MNQALAIIFAILILLTGIGLLAWLLAAGLWTPLDPVLAGGFSLVAGLFWLVAARRLLGAPAARRHYLSAAALVLVVTVVELGLILLTGSYTGIGMTLLVLGSSGALVFTVIRALLME